MNEVMRLAIEEARKTMNANLGGPFGAAVIDKDGNILSVASNTVLGDNDPTGHAEMNAIRQACKKIGSHDLTGCIIYATGQPCPMCLSAIIWSNIKTVYYGCNYQDTAEIGFRDDFIFKFIQDDCKDTETLIIEELDREQCLHLFREYEEKGKQKY